MKETIAIVGNPNCGKTTLFNALTGTHQKVGNWTGVTIEKKVGKYKKNKNVEIVDLPGLYSLNANAKDENIAYKSILKLKPKAIINVVDGTNLERNLYLTTELSDLKIPMVIAVNMSDQLEKNGIKLNEDELSKTFGVPVIRVSALKNKNLDELVELALSQARIPKLPNFSTKREDVVIKRYDFIEKSLKKIVLMKQTRAQILTEKIDDVLMNRVFGIPIFFLVMFLVYYLSINIGGFIGKGISNGFDNIGEYVSKKLNMASVSSWLISLTCDAVIGSIGGVLSFLPQILILFALMAIIEQSGYASRVAFLLDGFFRRFGLGGKSLLPMIVSCGCTVSGIMATRTIERLNERRMTIFLAPFMPCGAKTAVFAWFSSAFFGGSALVAVSMYFLGITCVGVFGKILKKLKVFSVDDGGFLMEIPTLRIPSIKDVVFVMIEKVKEFATKAGVIVFCVSIFLWLLKSVGVSGYVGNNVEKSFLFDIGNAIKYIFYPLGFTKWETSVAFIAGAFAKEAVVETLDLITLDVNTLFASKYSAYSFMSFILLSPPCVASLATAKQELGSPKLFIFMLLFQIFTAYIVAFSINIVCFIFDNFKGLLLSLIIVIMLTLSLMSALKRLKTRKCRLCQNCKGENTCQKAERFTT